ncbi:hypothetical protein BAY61_08965 [Prauserella marina]|uniref:Uncharacterized protein n=1 Tax=Prauserella marina TaxID=530584 RepID=A0A222VMI6_9PSEU|nr:hypothetical protein [Prauserella marina]ASR35087.1 hypothetical protein BAY61_08965 [Prauserella marina]PWV85161.1 hypothetical protein DES30_1011184 [Prauserella marina]SDC03400.1 hypothetical protein SAMN05421630_101154 [Prauserella marina]
MTEHRQHPSQSTARRWTLRGIAVSALALPLIAVAGGQASAAELAPIAEYLDSTIAATSASLVEALAILLGVG